MEKTPNFFLLTWQKCTKGTAKLKALAQSIFSHSISSITILITGNNLSEKFALEAGIHRIQRVPPTENKGRRHTSTIAVAVLPYNEYSEYQVDMSEFEIDCFCGGGPGGQHRNTTHSNVKITHKPTNLTACANTKSQQRNRIIALSVLVGRINALEQSADHQDYNEQRRSQIGNKGRGTKVRTYNFIESRVKDERVKKKFRTQDIMKGKLSQIYEQYMN